VIQNFATYQEVSTLDDHALPHAKAGDADGQA
jgi:hypothetical protein